MHTLPLLGLSLQAAGSSGTALDPAVLEWAGVGAGVERGGRGRGFGTEFWSAKAL